MKHSRIRVLSPKKRGAPYSDKITHILVGTATCGRAAGSMVVLEAFSGEIEGLKDKARVWEVGCMGLCSQEPLVTIIKPGDFSVCYHHVTPQMVPQLVEGYVRGDDPCLELALGTLAGGNGDGVYIPELDLFKYQSRVLLRNCGYISPLQIDHYLACGGYRGLAKALKLKPAQIIRQIEKSGLRGLGGAGYPAAAKWAACAKTESSTKYVICNADEGDPGAFMDRVLLESDPHSVLEGMIIAGYAVGAKKGYIYIREEYPLAIERIKIALKQARAKGLLGRRILDSGFSFAVEIIRGAGAFVSGEETAMIAAMEGGRSWPEHRP
ncbi:MAG: NADH-quinone oxidoreductase subunit F, partial [Dehalococcoidia bacterium]|nr:NADH-quinone oxidoreductase subunit F [Dehalococcoidia bacterium]